MKATLRHEISKSKSSLLSATRNATRAWLAQTEGLRGFEISFQIKQRGQGTMPHPSVACKAQSTISKRQAKMKVTMKHEFQFLTWLLSATEHIVKRAGKREIWNSNLNQEGIMSMNFKTIAALCAVVLGVTGTLAGCDAGSKGSANDSGSGMGSSLNSEANSQAADKNVTGYDAAVKTTAPESAGCAIRFTDNEVEVSGGAVDVNGTAVTINKPGIYSVSGSCSNGKIIVDAGKGNEVTLILDSVDLKSANNSVIECTSGKLITLYLAEGSVNTLSDSANYSFNDGGDEPDGAIYSKSDLVIAGSGKLTVNGLYKNGIKGKDTLSIDCGELVINAADNGIVGRDCVVIQDGSYTISAGGDGIKSTNDEDPELGYITINGGSFDIAAEQDGIQAETVVSVKGGTFKIVSGGEAADAEISASAGAMFDRDRFNGRGGSTSQTNSSDTSQKGIKAGTNIVIANGDIDIKAADDSIHSNGEVSVYGGTLKLSSCDDGIHADELLSISGGDISVSKSYEGLEGMNIEISGGNIYVNAVDDGINAAGGDGGSYFGYNSAQNDYYISITGGDIVVNASGDGIDSNGTIAQSGGNVTVYGPTNSGNGAIDYERSYTMSGGTLIALGASGMAQAPSTLSQPCLSINSNVAANSTIEVRDADGNVILSTTTPKSCQSLIFCCKEFKSGSKYGIYADNTLLSEVTATDGVAGGGASGMGGFGQGGHGGFGQGGFGQGGQGGSGQDGQSGFGQRGNKGGRPNDGFDFSNGDLPDDFDPNNGNFPQGGKFGGFDPNSGDFPQGGKFGGFDPNNSDFQRGGKFSNSDPNNSDFQQGSSV